MSEAATATPTRPDAPPAPPVLPIRQFQYRMPEGEGGVMETLKRMAEVIWHTSHSTRLAKFARDVIESSGVEEYDGRGEIQALYNWVTRNIRYTRDPYGYEWVQSVVPTLVFGHGDCDCQVVLLGSLLMSVGYPVRLVIVGSQPGKYHHVFLSTQYRGPAGIPVWINLDPTRPDGRGFGAKHDFPVERRFEVRPQGKLEESPMSSVTLGNVGEPSYGLGDYLADLGAPQYTVAFTLSNGRRVELPWAAHDLKYVSDEELRGWILSEFDPRRGQWSLEEVGELIAIVERMEEMPEVQALGLGDENLGGFWKKLKRGFKSAFKGIGKGLKKIVGSIPIVGKPIVSVASGLKNIIKAPFQGIKAAFQGGAPALLPAGAVAAAGASLLPPGYLATTPAGAPLYSADGGRSYVQADGTLYPQGHPVMMLPASAPQQAQPAPAPAYAERSFQAQPARQYVDARGVVRTIPPLQEPAPKRARVEIKPGAGQTVPEVKAKGQRNLILAAGGAAALGVGAYAYARSQA